MSAAVQSLADQWTAHANRTLPNDVSTAQVLRARRDWYFEQLERLGRIARRTAVEEAQFQEALGFARTIGRPVEMAS
jgi:hypothetical protein